MNDADRFVPASIYGREGVATNEPLWPRIRGLVFKGRVVQPWNRLPEAVSLHIGGSFQERIHIYARIWYSLTCLRKLVSLPVQRATLPNCIGMIVIPKPRFGKRKK